MAGSLNKATLIGRLGRDPEVKFTPSGQAVANFSIATDEEWKDKSGEKKKRTDWHRIVVWGKLAEVVGKHLGKGSQVYLEGRLQTREWMDKDDKKNYMTEVITDKIIFLGSKGERTAASAGGEEYAGRNDAGNEDIPF